MTRRNLILARREPRSGPLKDWATLDAPYLDDVREMVADGFSLAKMGRALGWNQSAVQRFLERNHIDRKAPVSRPVMILIEPVRWPTTNGIKGSGGFDLEDTGEL